MADMLSRATPDPTPDTSDDHSETELILMLHEPLQAAVSLQDLQTASGQDPTLSQLRTFIQEGWPAKVPEELVPYHRSRHDLSCWNGDCVVRGFPSALRGSILTMVHEGHLSAVRVK